jgi:tetratricopeptide (TPR) repeat protein/tRNA A-37 threonylcarbamoyl transferase component Bud32
MSPLFERLKSALADRYAVERELGQGGMATVFLAQDLKHERRVAIKVMGHDLAAQLGAERFLREIKTAAQLSHPNVLPLYDSGEADGLLYYVMPFVEGGSLRDRLDREGALPLDDALKIAQEVADALHHAHANGFIHRDIKPENILFVAGRPVVADFGIARAVSAAGGDQITQTGMAIGTPAYMSPEQAAGDPHVDGRSDIYALGCVLYEMLAGHPPFMGRNPREIIARHTVDAVPPLRTARPTVPPNVDETVVRALAKVPADRFPTARDFAEAIAGRLAAGPGGPSAVLAGLLSGRVLAIVTGYALVTVLAWVATRWMADRFALSPHLPGFVLAALGFLLPGVVAVAYIVGNRDSRWRAAHAAGLSANLAAAVVALVLLFGGKGLGAATMSVTLTDEDGKSVQRVIPKAEFRKRVALFYFDADPSDSLARELAYGIPDALGTDLLQDLFIDVRTPAYFRDRLRAAGHHDLTGVRLALAREIAAEQFRDQFVMGTVRTEGRDLVVSMSVYRTASGERISETTVRDPDPLALVDQLTAELRGTVEVPEGYAGTVTDLPVAELLTRSPTAFGHFLRAQRALIVDNDFARSASSLEAAIAADSTFAYAQYLLFIVYVYQNRGQEGRGPLQAAVNQVYRLPERMQNQVKANYYEMRQEPEKMYAVIQMNAELFPGDVQALSALAQIQMVRGQRREALATAQRVLDADPNQHDFLRVIAEIHQGLGEFDRALEYYAEYSRLNPNDRRGLLGTGDVQQALGNFDGARQAYERVRLLDPGNVEAALRIADLELWVSTLDRALAAYRETLDGARTAKDSGDALTGLAGYYAFRGQMTEAIRHRERAWVEEAKSVPPIQIMIERLQNLGDHIAAGDTARALELLAEYGRQLQPPFDAFSPLGELDIALELEDVTRIATAAAAIERVIERSSYGFLRSVAAFARGQAHYLRGEYREAISAWEEERGLNPRDPSIARQLGQAHRELKDHGRAEKALEEARRLRPADPRTRYELALLEEARGRRDRAIEHLRAALAVWADADPAYKWARRAREKLAQLEGRR